MSKSSIFSNDDQNGDFDELDEFENSYTDIKPSIDNTDDIHALEEGQKVASTRRLSFG